MNSRQEQQIIEAGNTMAALLVAGLLQWPVKEARLVNMWGRLALISYTPVQRPDPEILLLVARGAQPFNQAMKAFQEARHPDPDPGEWLSRAGEAAQAALEALRAVGGTPHEVVMAGLWLASKTAYMATVERLGPRPIDAEAPYYLREDFQGF